MLETFKAHLDVLWGFLIALAAVLTLTPAIACMGRSSC